MVEGRNFEKGHCPECGSERAEIKSQYKEKYSEPGIEGFTDYSILECRGCGNHYFKSLSSNSEDYDYFVDSDTGEEFIDYIETVAFWPPSTKIRPPDWMHEIEHTDRRLGSLFSDVFTALSNNLGVLSAIGMRTVFDRASELLGIDPDLPFAAKLKALKDGDHITNRERQVLQVLVDAGSAAAHRGWRPTPENLDRMINILQAFLYRTFVLEGVGEDLEKHVPPKNPRRRP